MLYADIILPLLPDQLFTYRIPEEMTGKAQPGMRAIIQFGKKKFYTGIIKKIHDNPGEIKEHKEITALPDDKPLVNDYQLNFWDWLSDYYMCSVGEIYKAALPKGLKPESESMIIFNSDYNKPSTGKKNTDILLGIIKNRNSVSLAELSRMAGKKEILADIHFLQKSGAIKMEEKFREISKPKSEKYLALCPSCHNSKALHNILDKLSKAPKQHKLLSEFIELAGDELFHAHIKYKTLLTHSSHSIISVLIKKGIFQIKLCSASPDNHPDALNSPVILNNEQKECYHKIKKIFREKDVCLLHGVTSSGKTEIYIHFISDMIKKGRQVLYLLPEIALTSQIIERLRAVFGDKAGIYHSRFNDNERIRVYNRLKGDTGNRYSIILGVRSSVFLPFDNLGLVIVDEEHENTYKQFDPAPRYHARDASIVLANIHKAKVILGTATPSVETWNNCKTGKYGLVQLKNRFGEIKLPQIIIANLREAHRKNKMKSVFTYFLLEEINKTISTGKQVILFQNRRGYSSYLECTVCGWIPRCKSCDVSLTYHKYSDSMVCHYCGYTCKTPAHCSECRSTALTIKGFGTERIEDEIQLLLPEAKPARLDLDTSRSVKSYHKILNDFSNGNTNILVGTQLISKGLDFGKVGLVGIINADQMLNYPDFRSYERSFQLIMQVSGRAGRRNERGKVIIQTSDPSNPVIRFVRDNNFEDFFKEQFMERQTFNYPPFVRIIKITLKHKNHGKVKNAASYLSENMRTVFGKRVLGPLDPLIGRIQTYYLKNILLKIEKNASFSMARMHVRKTLEEFQATELSRQVKVHVDVDPI